MRYTYILRYAIQCKDTKEKRRSAIQKGVEERKTLLWNHYINIAVADV